MKLTCSIAMATYNGERFLQEQLDSLAIQSVLPDELVVCDDASTDETIRILRAFAETAPFPVRIVENQENIGVFRNFELVTKLCEKDIILFCDQDDVWHPEKIEKVMFVFEAEPEVGLVLHDLEDVDQNLNPLPASYGAWRIFNTGMNISDFPMAFQKEAILPVLRNSLGSWHGCAMAYRRKWTSILLPFVGYHDRWILNFLPCFTRSRFLSEKLIYYRHHSNNVTAPIMGAVKKVKNSRKSFFRFIPRWWRSIKKRIGLYRVPKEKESAELIYVRQVILERIRTQNMNISNQEVVQYYQQYIL
ncbi:MAG: glycosyltransferase family 2 protein [Planctomycetia bacterium]|nr:glycosyltransferase family 2 protein [Planctomycetia bacterium]